MADITCVSPYWSGFTSLSANGSLHNCSTSYGSRESGASRTVTPMTPLEAYTLTPTTIDVWTVRNTANYIVSYDATEDLIKVKVIKSTVATTMAGSTTEGNTTIYGAVASSAAGSSDANGNNLGGRTTIDLSKGNSTYDPTNIPDLSGTSSAVTSTDSSNSRMLWVRYL